MMLLNVLFCITSMILVKSSFTFEEKLSEITKHELWNYFTDLTIFHEKKYNSTVELYLRFKTFLKNINKINFFNQQKKTHNLRINNFKADRYIFFVKMNSFSFKFINLIFIFNR